MDHQIYFPRVLIVGASFDSITGYGITLSNLFRGWPKDRLAVIGDLKDYPNAEICNQYYRLAADEYYYIWPLSFIKHKRKSGGVNLELETSGYRFSSEINNIWQRNTGHVRTQGLIWKMIYAIDDIVGSDRAMRRIRLSSTLFEWTKRYCPDLIYTQGDCLLNISLVNQLVETFHIPFVIHMMDDWPSTLYADKLLAPYLRWRLNKDFLDLLNRSSGFMGISQKMCEVYQQRYQRPCIPFHNPLDLESWLNYSKRDWRAGKPFRIMYRGRIGKAIQTSLIDICDAVSELFQDGRAIQFDIIPTPTCDANMRRLIERSGCVKVNSPIPYKGVPASLANADLLVLSYDFDPDSVEFIRYSMPTKASEFMVSGTPVLIYGKEDLAITEFAQKEKWGYTVSERNIELLKQGLIKLMEDQSLRERLGRRAHELAVRNYDAIRVRESFRHILASATNCRQ